MNINNTIAAFSYLTVIAFPLHAANHCSGTSVSGASAVTINAETKYINCGNTLSGTVDLNNASAILCVDSCGSSGNYGTWTGSFFDTPTSGSTINVYGKINTTSSWSFTFGGMTVNVYDGGTLNIDDFSATGGTYTINNWGTVVLTGDLSVSGGTITFNNYGTFTIQGNLSATTSGFTFDNKSGGTLTVQGASGLSMTDGTIINSGTLTITNDFNQTGGTFTNSGPMTCRDFSKTFGTFTNNSTITVTRNFSNTGTLTNNSKFWITGDFTNTGTITLGPGAYFSGATFSNTGTINGPASGCSAFDISGNTTNTGTVSAGNSSRVDFCDAGSPPGGVDVNTGNLNSATFCTCSVLPVSFLNFNAEAVENKKIMLQWTTGTETNNDYFTIERSDDGVHFDQMTKMKGAGTSSTAISYLTIDDQPLEGLSYYRIRQSDFDGKYSFSRIAAVKIALSEELRLVNLFPVPAGEQLTFIIYSPSESESKIEIVDAQGKYVSSKYEHLIKGVNEFTIESFSYSKGLYLLRVATGEAVIMKNFSK